MSLGDGSVELESQSSHQEMASSGLIACAACQRRRCHRILLRPSKTLANRRSHGTCDIRKDLLARLRCPHGDCDGLLRLRLVTNPLTINMSLLLQHPSWESLDGCNRHRALLSRAGRVVGHTDVYWIMREFDGLSSDD